MHIIDCEMICYTKILCRKKLIDIFVAFDRFLLYITSNLQKQRFLLIYQDLVPWFSNPPILQKVESCRKARFLSAHRALLCLRCWYSSSEAFSVQTLSNPPFLLLHLLWALPSNNIKVPYKSVLVPYNSA